MSVDAVACGPDEAVHQLDPERLPDHIDALYRAARAMCRSQHDAEDLVQDTLAYVLRRPRWIRRGNERAYLMRALKNTYINRLHSAARKPAMFELDEHDAPAPASSDVSARDLMDAIASAPEAYRDAVVAIDILGLSYREAARALRTREATITSRLHRGRQYIARAIQ